MASLKTLIWLQERNLQQLKTVDLGNKSKKASYQITMQNGILVQQWEEQE